MKKSFSVYLLLLGLSGSAGPKPDFIDWKDLHNPVLEYPDWSIKRRSPWLIGGGVFYVFFSAFL